MSEEGSEEIGEEELQSYNDLLSLPDMVLFKVLSHLSVPELCRISMVNKKLYDYAHDPVLWKVLDFSGKNVSVDDVRRLLQNAVRCEELVLLLGSTLDSSLLLEIPKLCGSTLRKLKITFCKALNVGVLEHIVARCNQIECVNFEGCERLSLTVKTLSDLEVDANANRSGCTACYTIVPATKTVLDATALASGCVLAMLPYLRSINLSHCALIQNDELVSLVSTLRCIERLNIDGILNARDAVVFALCERHAATLTHLFLDGENLTVECTSALGQCIHLRALGVSFSQQFEDSAMRHFNKLQSLEMLRLRKLTAVSPSGLFDLFADGRLSKLRHFEVTECQSFTNETVSSLISCCGTRLEVLVLSWAFDIDDAGVSTIVHNCANLHRLDLSGLFRISGTVFAETPLWLPHLGFLNLEQCNSVDDGVLQSLVNNKTDICVVDYYGEKMGNECVKRTELSEYEFF